MSARKLDIDGQIFTTRFQAVNNLTSEMRLFCDQYSSKLLCFR